MKLSELANKFAPFSLSQPLPAEAQIKCEEEKLLIYQELENYLKTLIAQQSKPLKEKVKKPKRFLLLRKAIYYFLLAFGFLESAVGSFLFAQNLLILIPFFSSPMIIVGSVVITIINSILFYAFEASIFKKALGIPVALEEQGSLIQTYTAQVASLEKINKYLFNIQLVAGIPQHHYQQLAKVALLMNQDIAAKQQALGKYREAMPQKIARYLVTGFGALMTGAGTYFMATSLLTLISAPLLGTPVGWIFIGLMIVAGLGFYLSMQGQGMVQLINPEYISFKTLKTNLNKFECKNESDFQLVDELQTELTLNALAKLKSPPKALTHDKTDTSTNTSTNTNDSKSSAIHAPLPLDYSNSSCRFFVEEQEPREPVVEPASSTSLII